MRLHGIDEVGVLLSDEWLDECTSSSTPSLPPTSPPFFWRRANERTEKRTATEVGGFIAPSSPTASQTVGPIDRYPGRQAEQLASGEIDVRRDHTGERGAENKRQKVCVQREKEKETEVCSGGFPPRCGRPFFARSSCLYFILSTTTRTTTRTALFSLRHTLHALPTQQGLPACLPACLLFSVFCLRSSLLSLLSLLLLSHPSFHLFFLLKSVEPRVCTPQPKTPLSILVTPRDQFFVLTGSSPRDSHCILTKLNPTQLDSQLNQPSPSPLSSDIRLALKSTRQRLHRYLSAHHSSIHVASFIVSCLETA